ncbi:helix-turn-helix domain-containing protein [Actinomadura parmotrematis]|uniref:helix-turn-helix domain-containing protein n=1 Tax=Actinomadura parmotrematis TaxID=2864039 RepID=UPI00215D7B44|nr:helix-turn-helix domain-containing protein [Actinomadura parmotrematis]
MDLRPFDAIPAWVGARLRLALDGAADDLIHELLGHGHGPPLDPPARDEDGLRAVVRAGLRHFCDLLEDPATGWDGVAARYRDVGRAMARNGRDPAEAHRALRRAALAAWRGIGSFTAVLDLDQDVLGQLMEAQFGYLDALSSLVTAGYQAEYQEAAETVRRHRTRLLALLLAEPAAAPHETGALAARARWPLPRTVAAAAVRPRHGGASRLAVPDDLLVDFGGPEPHMLLPGDGSGRGGDGAAALEALAPDWIVAVGPAVPTARARESLRWARDTLTLAVRGVVPSAGLVRSAEHLAPLVVFRAGELIDDAAGARLAPLSRLAPAQRDRLTRTLLALLESNFNAAQASKRLSVHPQTVRYRLRQLEGLFGDGLRDPRRCLELELILHARLAARAAGGPL